MYIYIYIVLNYNLAEIYCILIHTILSGGRTPPPFCLFYMC